MYNFIELGKSKKVIATFFVLGGLLFAVAPVEGRWHFSGGAVKDYEKILEEIKVYEEQVKMYQEEAEKYLQQVKKYTSLAQRICALTGLNYPGFLNTVEKYSNAYVDFAGKTIVDLDNKTTTELDLIKDMGQYDLDTSEGRRNYTRHLLEQYQLTNLETLQLMSRYATNNEVKQKMIDEAMKIDITATSVNAGGELGENAGSRVAAIQQKNIVDGLQANADINNAQNEIIQMTNNAERTRLEILQKNQERSRLTTLNSTPDPYHMTEETKEKWKEINQPDVTLGFTGKKK